MIKMKDVCQLTGLTERAVRLYVQEELIKPEVRKGAHNKAYFFSIEEIERLKDISTLRSAGFSIADIKLMLESPFNISKTVREREESLEKEIKHLQYIQETLKYLSIQEHNDVTKLANAIEPRSRYAKERSRYRRPRWAIVIVALIVFLLFPLSYTIQTGEFLYTGIFFSIAISGGIFFLIMSVEYFVYCIKLRFKKNNLKEHITTGKIVAIVSNEGIKDYIGESTVSVIWEIITLGLVIWNDFRPDHWFPLIQFEMKNGQTAASTFRYGGFKSFWKIGDEVEIVWEDEKTIYPKNVTWLVKKAIVHLLAGIGMLIMSDMLYYYFIK